MTEPGRSGAAEPVRAEPVRAEPTSEQSFARAQRILPGGVNSPVRAFGAVGGTPPFIVAGHGPYVVSADGHEYVDLVSGWGPAILGHSHPAVVRAVRDAAERGLSFGAPTTAETELALVIADRVAAVERVRLVSTGTEATMTAIRLARGFTGRDVVVKFAGHYHGHSDGLLASAGSGVATFALPGSAGVPAPVAAQTIVLEYNDLDAVAEVFASHGDSIAAVITEAAPANMGVITPLPGFNAELARIAHQHGALLIFDEVLTGFRVGPAGWWGLENEAHGPEIFAPSEQQYLPDLFAFGKVIGGGLPVAAVAGRADVMDQLAPAGPVYQAGTLSGNPVAVAAGLATLAAADDEVYARLDHASTTISAEVSRHLGAEGVPHRICRAGNLFSVAFVPAGQPVRNYAEIQRQDSWRYPPFFHAMLAGGVSLPPSVYEAWFVSAAHDDAAIERIIAALPAAARAAAEAVPN